MWDFSQIYELKYCEGESDIESTLSDESYYPNWNKWTFISVPKDQPWKELGGTVVYDLDTEMCIDGVDTKHIKYGS